MSRLVMSLVAALLLAGAALPARAQDTLASVYEAAKKEGKVVYWSSLFTSTVERLSAEFAKRFPGIKVEPFRLSNTEIVQRVMRESDAGQYEVDQVDLPILYLPQLQAKSLIEPYQWNKVFGVPESLIFGDGAAVATFHIDLPIAVNTDMVTPAEIKTWEDLADPKWRGKLLVEARAQAFYVLSLAWGEEKADKYTQAIVANRPTVIAGGAAVVENLAGGQAAAAIGALGNRIIQYKEKGAPVDWARVGPIPAVIYLDVVLKEAPHPNAARLWTWFLTTSEAQKILWEEERFGFLAGGALSPHGEDIEKAGLKVIFESPDEQLASKRIGKYVEMLSGLRN